MKSFDDINTLSPHHLAKSLQDAVKFFEQKTEQCAGALEAYTISRDWFLVFYHPVLNEIAVWKKNGALMPDVGGTHYAGVVVIDHIEILLKSGWELIGDLD